MLDKSNFVKPKFLIGKNSFNVYNITLCPQHKITVLSSSAKKIGTEPKISAPVICIYHYNLINHIAYMNDYVSSNKLQCRHYHVFPNKKKDLAQPLTLHHSYGSTDTKTKKKIQKNNNNSKQTKIVLLDQYK